MVVKVQRERTVAQSAISGQKQSIDTPSAAFGALEAQAAQNAGTALQRMANVQEKKAIDELDRRNEIYALDVQNRIEDELNDFVYNPEGGLLRQKGQNGINAHGAMKSKLDEIRQKYLNDPKMNQDTSDMLTKAMTKIEDRYNGLAQRHAFSETETYERDALQARQTLAQQNALLNVYDDTAFEESFSEVEAALEAEQQSYGRPAGWLTAKKKESYSRMRLAQIQQLVNTGQPEDIVQAFQIMNDQGIRGKLSFDDRLRASGLIKPHIDEAVAEISLRGLDERGPAVLHNFEGSIAFVIDELEIDPNDPGREIVDQGGATIMGVSANAHPETVVKLRELVQAGDIQGARKLAESVYKDEYWDANKIGEMPPHLRMVALSTAINHGSGFKNDIFKKIRNGDITTVEQVINLRNEEYLRLARENPEKHGDSLRGWENRLRKEADAMKTQVFLPDVIAEANRLRGIYGDAAADTLIQKYEANRKASNVQRLANEDRLMDIVMGTVAEGEQPMPLPQREAMINEAELKGEIGDTFAKTARRYLKSAEKVDGRTSEPKMADIIMQVYDLNAQADLDPESYLTGLRNIREEIMQMRADGELTADDEEKLNKQMKTLTSNKTAETTQNIAYQFGDATDVFTESLPPEYRGQAIRELFYATAGREDLDDSEYKAMAHQITDRIKLGRRERVVKNLDTIVNDNRFGTVEEAEAADLPPGTVIYIGGRKAVVR